MTKNISFLTPTRSGVLVYSALTLFQLLFYRLESGIRLVTQDEAATSSFFESIERGREQLVNLLNEASFFSSAATFLAWVLAGCVVYVLVVSVSLLLSEAGEAFTVEEFFMHSKGFRKGEVFRSFLLKTFVRIGAVVILLFYVYISWAVLFPACIDLVDAFLNNAASIAGAVSLLVGILGFLVCYHVYTILLRIVFLRKRLFYVPELG